MNQEFDWSTVSDHTLAQMARDYSAAQIAKELGCLRNAVIGRCRRRNIALSRYIVSTVDPIKQEANRRSRQRQRYATRRAQLLGNPVPDEVEISAPEPIPDHDRVGLTLMELRERTCRFPLWAANSAPSDKRYCGAEAASGQVYCAYCTGLAYSPRRTAILDRKLGVFKLPRAA